MTKGDLLFISVMISFFLLSCFLVYIGDFAERKCRCYAILALIYIFIIAMPVLDWCNQKTGTVTIYYPTHTETYCVKEKDIRQNDNGLEIKTEKNGRIIVSGNYKVEWNDKKN